MARIAIVVFIATGLACLPLLTGATATLTAVWRRAARTHGRRWLRRQVVEPPGQPSAGSLEADHAATPGATPQPLDLAALHHEIRTPMNGLLGMTELLLHTELDAEQHRLAETLSASGLRLMVVIDELLARMESSHDHGDPERAGTRGPARALGHEGATSTAPPTRPTVLLIEPDPLTQHVITLLLEQVGCSVGVAATSAEAIEMVERGRFDAIVVHCEAPTANDFAASLMIRHGDGEAIDIPIITLAATTTGGAGDADRRPRWMTDHLTRPSSHADLVASLRRHGVCIEPDVAEPPSEEAPLILP